MTENSNGAGSAADKAPMRFFILIALRFVAAFMVLGGIMLALDRVPGAAPEVGRPIGYVLVGLGMLDLVLVIPFLARRWRSPNPD